MPELWVSSAIADLDDDDDDNDGDDGDDVWK